MNLIDIDGIQHKVAVIGGTQEPYTVIERGSNLFGDIPDPEYNSGYEHRYLVLLKDNLSALEFRLIVNSNMHVSQYFSAVRFTGVDHYLRNTYAQSLYLGPYKTVYKYCYVAYFRDLSKYGLVQTKSQMETGLYVDNVMTMSGDMFFVTGGTYSAWDTWIHDPAENTDNEPYVDHGDDSTTGGGTGTFDMGNDPITTPAVPSVSALTGQLLSMYAPTASELEQLSNFLWSNNFIDNIPKLFGNPFESLIALYLIGIQPPAEGSKEYVQLGYVSSGVQMYPVNTQFTTFDCGNLKIPLFWANALDYSPYTKLNIYLPYIGYRALDPDIIIDATVNLKYYIDLLTGSCTAILKVTKGNLSNIMYSFTGNICTQIPLTGSDSTAMTRTLVTAGVTVGALPLMPSVSAMTAATTATAMQVMGSKATVEQGGTAGSSYGLLSCKTPHIIINRPVQSKPENYQNYKGFPCNITAQLSSLSGYTEILEIHLENINATKSELDELENLLKSGVIL